MYLIANETANRSPRLMLEANQRFLLLQITALLCFRDILIICTYTQFSTSKKEDVCNTQRKS